MGIEASELIESATSTSEKDEPQAARLNATVAVTVAILATFLGICKVKDDNIVQAMHQAQADKIDLWGYYQARNLREEVALATTTQLELSRLGAAPEAQAAYDTAIAKYKALAADQNAKKKALQTQAEQAQKTYETLNGRDDQFDISDALLAIAIAMLAVTALTQLWPLYWVALVPTVLGVVMGFAGLANLPISANWLAWLL